MAQNGSNSSQNFDFLTQKFKMAQTHLKSFNGRQGGILQSISGVSGASGGLKSQNFDFLTQKFKMAVFARFHFLKSKNPISGHNQARLTSGDPQNKLLLMIKFSPFLLCFTLFYSVLLCFTQFYSVLLCFTLFYSVLLCFTPFQPKF